MAFLFCVCVLLVVNYKIIIQLSWMPYMAAFTTNAIGSNMFTIFINTIGRYISVFYLKHVGSYLVINDLKITTSAFWAFLVCHDFSFMIVFFCCFCAYFQAVIEIGVGGKTPVILYGGLTTVVRCLT